MSREKSADKVQTAFGGVPSGLTLIEGLLKEAQEEASFPPEHLRHRIK